VNVEDFGRREIFGECWRFWAEHYRFRRIEKFIDCRGNALPLRQLIFYRFSENDGGDGEEAGDR